jgi:glycosyltransferase involved in cell wall biosynthesis
LLPFKLFAGRFEATRQDAPLMVTSKLSTPFVSIILPIRNEAKFIACSLSAVLNQDYPGEQIEIIVADGMSADGTRQIVESFKDNYPNVRLIDNVGQIVPTALNAAIAEARGDIIVRVDGHCRIERDYVRNCVTHLLNDGVDGVGGPLTTVGETLMATAIAEGMSSHFGVGNSAFRTITGKTMLTDTVAFPTYTRTILERGGFFDEELIRNQDDEYNYRLREIGAKILLAADVRSTYYSRSSLRSLWKQYYQYGYWKVRVMQKHPRQMRLRHFIPFLFVLCLMTSLVVVPIFNWGKWVACFVVGSYVFADLLSSIRIAVRKGWRLFPLLLPTFPTLHLAYGFGFLTGLLKFRKRWLDRDITGVRSNRKLSHQPRV